MQITLVPTDQKQSMNISKVTASSGGPIIRPIHRIWHFPTAFCFGSLRDI
jgi:hypothetical protein